MVLSAAGWKMRAVQECGELKVVVGPHRDSGDSVVLDWLLGLGKHLDWRPTEKNLSKKYAFSKLTYFLSFFPLNNLYLPLCPVFLRALI